MKGAHLICPPLVFLSQLNWHSEEVMIINTPRKKLIIFRVLINITAANKLLPHNKTFHPQPINILTTTPIVIKPPSNAHLILIIEELRGGKKLSVGNLFVWNAQLYTSVHSIPTPTLTITYTHPLEDDLRVALLTNVEAPALNMAARNIFVSGRWNE